MDKVTVVTVTFNAQDEIEDTMKSVLEQDYSNVEYLIMDGHSTDNTIAYAKEVKDKYSGNVSCSIYSERDKGIYDAMNKAIQIASGEWILFMNAGDSFYSPNVISSVFQKDYPDSIKGVYGDTERFSGDWKKVVKAHVLDEIKDGYPLPFCHQSVFVRTDILKSIMFDIRYKQAADYNFFVQCFLKKYHFEYVNIIVSKYAMGGISETNTVYHLKEKIDIREKNKLESYTTIKKKYLIGKLYFKQVVKKYLPRIIIKKMRGY